MAKATKIEQKIDKAITDLKNETSSRPEITKENAEEIAAFLKANASIPTVYFNESGDWSFHEREGFTYSVSREEILGLPPIETDIIPETPTE